MVQISVSNVFLAFSVNNKRKRDLKKRILFVFIILPELQARPNAQKEGNLFLFIPLVCFLAITEVVVGISVSSVFLQ